MTDDEDPLLTVTEIARKWQVSKMTVYRMVHSGGLAAIRIGHSFHIPRTAVETFHTLTGPTSPTTSSSAPIRC